MAFRILFAIAAYYNLDIDQIKVKITFFYGLIDQVVYVQIQKGSENSAKKKIAYKVFKALNNLK